MSHKVMVKTLQAATIALALLLAGSITAPAQRGSAAPSTGPALPVEVGKPFPVLALPALDSGRPVSIVDFRGKKIILHVFASW